ncbi:MAG: hypothetical protein JNK92_14030 [Dechloromonas sp.]|nr:hypothetical protein [Dechloromonas sp.]
MSGFTALVQSCCLAEIVIDIRGVGGKASRDEHQGKRKQGKEMVPGQSNRREC